jgi:hypothetical protein
MKEEHLYFPSHSEVAYCAGLFEGEGCILTTKQGWPVIAIVMTDREPLEQFERYMGGAIAPTPKTPRQPHHKIQYSYRAYSWRDVIRIGEQLYPWLSPRRQEQVDKVLRQRPEHPRGTASCPKEPFPSTAGYQRHRRLGEKPCEMCRQSNNLFYMVQGHRQHANTRAQIRAEDWICPTEVLPTARGYQYHRRRKEPVCDICRLSYALYQKRMRDARVQS